MQKYVARYLVRILYLFLTIEKQQTLSEKF